MIETYSKLPPDKIYSELKENLLDSNCKIIIENPPRRIIAEHGSFWNYSPRTYRKKIIFNLISSDSGTRIISNTFWKGSQIASAVFALIIPSIAVIGLWSYITYIGSLIYLQRSGLVGWLLSLIGTTYAEEYIALVRIIKNILLIITAIIFISFIHISYCYIRREIVAQDILNFLPNRVRS